jgi:hypothetical protein
MRISTTFGLTLAALLFQVALTPTRAWAGTGPVITNCPPEPAQGVPIVSGQTYYGTNCVLKTTGDADEFTFRAAAGDTWQVILGLGASPTTNITLTIYAPGLPLTQIYSAPTNIHPCCGNAPYYAVSTNQTLTVAGTYTILVSETNDAVQTYALSLERLSPTPPDATPLVLSQGITGAVNAPTEQITYSFNGSTTGEYEIAASLTASPTSNVCMSVYQPNGTSALSGGQYICTNIYPCCGNQPTYSIQTDLVPPVNGAYVVEMAAGGNDTTVGYNLEVSCLSGPGTCLPVPPRCALKDSPTYDATSGTLTMNFTIGTPTAATWNIWLTYDSTMENLYSQSQPKTEPPITVTKTQALGASGTVGVLSTLTTPTKGITCSSWESVNTGTP